MKKKNSKKKKESGNRRSGIVLNRVRNSNSSSETGNFICNRQEKSYKQKIRVSSGMKGEVMSCTASLNHQVVLRHGWNGSSTAYTEMMQKKGWRMMAILSLPLILAITPRTAHNFMRLFYLVTLGQFFLVISTQTISQKITEGPAQWHTS